jgi:hypothetical protein
VVVVELEQLSLVGFLLARLLLLELEALGPREPPQQLLETPHIILGYLLREEQLEDLRELRELRGLTDLVVEEEAALLLLYLLEALVLHLRTLLEVLVVQARLLLQLHRAVPLPRSGSQAAAVAGRLQAAQQRRQLVALEAQ